MQKKNRRLLFTTLYWVIGLAIIFGLPRFWVSLHTRTITYSSFKGYVRQDRILYAALNPQEIKGVIFTGPKDAIPKIRKILNNWLNTINSKNNTFPEETGHPDVQQVKNALKRLSKYDKDLILFKTVRVKDPTLIKDLDSHHVDYTGVEESLFGKLFWSTILPIAFWIGLWIWLIKGMGSPGAGMLSIGKSKAKIAMEKETGVSFDSVAGCDEAKEELGEVVQFLKNPHKYEQLGAKIPKGVLLVGPPGTGKTLLSRALAGEAKVPFYSISGSEFVEMFVGVGAARVRDLFNQAKQNAPCIIFIDEIDAIGKFRSGGPMAGGHEEREQTLNQLLVEMDGFEPNIGVIILAATNRPEVLDPALLRPGRFDRQVVLDAPDVRGREAILKVHAKGKPLEPDVNLREVALRTPGFSGADLANVMNEAALLAAREGAKTITQAHLNEAVEKVVAGPERKSRRLGKRERERVAVHEAGHALVAYFCPNAPPVAKISIVPRGKAALGYTLQLPQEEQYLMTQSELLDKICVSLGGRAAERAILKEISSGAQNDLEVATEMARSMVCRFGMSEKVGPMALSRETSPFLRGPMDFQQPTALSPDLAAQVDDEVRKVLREQADRASKTIESHKDALARVVKRLLDREVLSADEFRALVTGEDAVFDNDQDSGSGEIGNPISKYV